MTLLELKTTLLSWRLNLGERLFSVYSLLDPAYAESFTQDQSGKRRNSTWLNIIKEKLGSEKDPVSQVIIQKHISGLNT